MKRKSKKGGFLSSRFQALQQGTKTLTYCCDGKQSNFNDGTNIGSNCKPSPGLGQCYPGYSGQSYKFRCFNHDDTKDHSTISELQNQENGEKCEYVSGALSKAFKPIARTGQLLALPIVGMVNKAQGSGGKRRKTRKMYKKGKKMTKSQKNKSRRIK